MNIFVLSLDHNENAQYHVDKHVVKMILETAQILSTNVRYFGIDAGYRSTHLNHPCTKWARESLSNHKWLIDLAEALNSEWQYRFGHTRNHKSYDMIKSLPLPVSNMQDIGLTPFAKAMPNEYVCNDPVLSYREYYLGEKQNIFKWTNRPVPFWIKEQMPV